MQKPQSLLRNKRRDIRERLAKKSATASFLNIAAVVLWASTVVLALVSLQLSLNVNRSLKRLDIVVQCQNRFEKIYFFLRPDVKANKYDVSDYYKLYWCLQIDQYQYWKEGFINDDTYSYWMFWRYKEWETNEEIQGIDYHSGWQYVVDCFSLRDKEFYVLMQSVFKGDNYLVKMYKEKHVP